MMLWVETYVTRVVEAKLAAGFAELDFFQQRRGHGRDLVAFGGAGDGNAGLVEDAFGAALRIEIAEELADQRAVLALAVVGDLAGRRRGKDQRIVGRADRREPMRVGTEAALIGIAAGGIDDDELSLGALLLHHLEHT